jgi:hypothetical protein
LDPWTRRAESLRGVRRRRFVSLGWCSMAQVHFVVLANPYRPTPRFIPATGKKVVFGHAADFKGIKQARTWYCKATGPVRRGRACTRSASAHGSKRPGHRQAGRCYRRPPTRFPFGCSNFSSRSVYGAWTREYFRAQAGIHGQADRVGLCPEASARWAVPGRDIRDGPSCVQLTIAHWSHVLFRLLFMLFRPFISSGQKNPTLRLFPIIQFLLEGDQQCRDSDSCTV